MVKQHVIEPIEEYTPAIGKKCKTGTRKNKNKTRIGKNAFIGSDSILVAPVFIGDEAMTGAGCVVTKGQVVPRRGIVVGVPARLIHKHSK